MANIGYMQLVRHCDQSCRFCSNPATPNVLTLEQARQQVDDLVERGYFGVVLTGGEPSLSPIAPEVTRYAAGRGLHVRMISNGSRLGEAEYAARLLEAGLAHFHLSIHSSRPDIQDHLTGTPGSFARIMTALETLGGLGASVDINTVICRHNADHLDVTVRELCSRFPFLRHFVWNNIDPTIGLARENPDVRARLADFELSLHRAMSWLADSDRTFRAERVPLCYMADHAHCSTETRKIVKGEERIVHFLDDKGTVRQTDFGHGKSEVCGQCTLDAICAGLYDAGGWYELEELHALFVSAQKVIQKVLQGEG